MNSHYVTKYKNKKYPHTVKQKSLYGKSMNEKNLTSSLDFIQGEKKVITIDGVKIIHINGHYQSNIEIEVKHSFPFLKIHFELEGRSEYNSKIKANESVIIDNGCYNLFYLPQVNGTLNYPKSPRNSLEITFSESFLKKIFKNNLKIVCPALETALKNKQTFKMFDSCQAIPSTLFIIINDIIQCTYQKEIKEVYLRLKIAEIFTYIFSDINRIEHNKNSKIDIGNAELQEILKAEKILQENFKKPPTIKELSLQTGINQCKLKTNFKKVYGKPIFQYITQIRMEKANRMLIENENITIAEIAYAVGYKNPQHFTVAFKKKFNYLPSDLKNKLWQ